MPNRPPTYRPPKNRPEAPPPTRRATAAERGYGYRWQQARAAFLAANPLCRECEKEGRVTEATVVDHIIPHKGDETLFWDEAGNWQSLCVQHHNEKTAKEGAFGRPMEPNHADQHQDPSVQPDR
jgi:5-methylcytosine-specific restriction protein A